MFEITGERLRIAGNQANATGLFLRAEDGTEIKIEKLLRNDPGYISGRAPDILESGGYKIVIKTQYNKPQFLNEVRVGISEFNLIVS